MTGLDLESFLLLLRADLGVWLMLGLAILALAFLVWSSWRSRRALRNCLVVSLAAHLALVIFGSTVPGLGWPLSPNRRDRTNRPRIREIRVAMLADPAAYRAGQSIGSSMTTKCKDDGPKSAQGPRLDLVDLPLHLAEPHLQVGRPPAVEAMASLLKPEVVENTPAAVASAVPKGSPLATEPRAPERRALADTKSKADPPAAADPLPPEALELDRTADDTKTAGAGKDGRANDEGPGSSTRAPMLALRYDRRLRPDRPELGSAADWRFAGFDGGWRSRTTQ